jgi:hypothetical protein
MTVYALHEGIQFQLEEVRPGEWRWSFQPPTGPGRSGRVMGNERWARVVARRAIDIWHLMNPKVQAA